MAVLAHRRQRTRSLDCTVARWALDALGRNNDAKRDLPLLEAKYAADDAAFVAAVCACLKNLDRAFAWADRAYRQHDGYLAFLKLDLCFKNLKPGFRYKAFLQKMKLPE